jgi:exopolysaccharide biosynthesis WecB/TagA/CpsF family protein
VLARTVPDKCSVLGVLVDAVDIETATDRVVDAALDERPMSVAAFAVHAVMMAARDRRLRAQVNRIDLVGADGQPVRWALNVLHGMRVKERVYGPELMRRLCAAAERERLPIYLYGSWPETVEALRCALARDFPHLEVAGGEPAQMVDLDFEAQNDLAKRIRDSGARLVFVGLGCPRQEQFVWAMRDHIGVPLVAVGAAFDYNAGLRPEAPRWMMRTGLQWVQRLAAEPRRLWRRYVVLNPLYLLGLCAQLLRVWRPSATLPEPQRADVPG